MRTRGSISVQKIIVSIFLILATACSSLKEESLPVKSDQLNEMLDRAEAQASEPGRKVLETARAMISNKDIVVGGCWDFLNTVYVRAGFGDKKRETVFQSKLKGPYLEQEADFEPGDWLYFINHSYRNTEHSALFVAWIDRDNRVALMASYVGEKKKRPAFYKKFVLDKVYHIIRAR